MKTYDLYLHSGPMMRKTYIHVPSILGCIAQGDTTEAAIVNAPDAIRTYLAFLERSGESASPAAPFDTRVADHNKDGSFLGGGFLRTDAEAMSTTESDRLMRRLASLHAELRRITDGLTPKQLDAQPSKGRSIHRILTHVCVEGGYLRGVKGASRLQRQADEGLIDPRDALDQLHELEIARLHAMDDEERSAVVLRGENRWSVRSAMRKMLEHAWEHHLEMAERLGRAP